MSWDTQSKNIINIGNYYYLFDVKPKRFKNGWPRNKILDLFRSKKKFLEGRQQSSKTSECMTTKTSTTTTTASTRTTAAANIAFALFRTSEIGPRTEKMFWWNEKKSEFWTKKPKFSLDAVGSKLWKGKDNIK